MLWKRSDPEPARRDGAAQEGVRTWEVPATRHNSVTVTARRGVATRDVLLTTGCVSVESFDRGTALLFLRMFREAVSWAWPEEPHSP